MTATALRDLASMQAADDTTRAAKRAVQPNSKDTSTPIKQNRSRNARERSSTSRVTVVEKPDWYINAPHLIEADLALAVGPANLGSRLAAAAAGVLAVLAAAAAVLGRGSCRTGVRVTARRKDESIRSTITASSGPRMKKRAP